MCRLCHLVLKTDNPLAASSDPALTSAGPSSDPAPLSMITLPGSPATRKSHSKSIIAARQRSCGKIMLLQTCVILSTRGPGMGWVLIPPMHGPGILRDTVDKWVVRILLDCFVSDMSTFLFTKWLKSQLFTGSSDNTGGI